MEGARPGGLRGRDPVVRPFRLRRPGLRTPRQGRCGPGHLLRQRPMRPVPGPGRRRPREVLHGARPPRRPRRAGRRAARAPSRRPRRRRPWGGPPHRDRPRARPDHRRRAGRALRRDRARPARHRNPSRRRQAPARRQARPADPPVLRLHRSGLRRHPGHRHRHPLGERGPLVPRRPGLAPDDGPGRLQRQEGRPPRRGPEIRPRRARRSCS